MSQSQFLLVDESVHYTDNFVKGQRDDIRDPFDGFLMLFRGEEYRERRSREIPDNWIAPRNFADGRAHYRVEVFEKPNDTHPTALLCRMTTECHHGTHNVHLGYRVCQFRAKGLFHFEQDVRWAFPMVPLTQFRWDLPIWEVQLVVTDQKGGTVHKLWEQGGHICHPYEGLPNLGLYLPLRVRFSIVVVGHGEKFVPPEWWLVPGSPPPLRHG